MKWKKNSFRLRLCRLWIGSRVSLYFASPSCRVNALTVDTHKMAATVGVRFRFFCGVVRILYSLVSLCGVLFGVLLMYVFFFVAKYKQNGDWNAFSTRGVTKLGLCVCVVLRWRFVYTLLLFSFFCLCFWVRTFKYALTCTRKSLRDDILF